MCHAESGKDPARVLLDAVQVPDGVVLGEAQRARAALGAAAAAGVVVAAEVAIFGLDGCLFHGRRLHLLQPEAVFVLVFRHAGRVVPAC